MAPMNIAELPGLECEHVSRLQGAGVRTSRQLLRVSRRRNGFTSLAKAADLQLKDLEQIVSVAELGEIQGIGRTALNQLLEAGVTSPGELSAEEPAELQTRLRKAGVRPPNLAVLEHWIIQARRRKGGRGQGISEQT